MDKGWQDLLERFISLGGIAENVCQREGEFGRGIFSIDPSRRVKITTPKNLLINRDNIGIHDGEIMFKDKTCFSTEETMFLQSYYNDYSWGNNGNSDSAEFLKFIASIPESLNAQLLGCGFVDKNLLAYCENEEHLFKRFIDERSVRFDGCSVLAPVWEFVNHSSFAPPLRISPFGVGTPPLDLGTEEVLFKYSGKNSSMGMWKKYGFTCRCIVAYSVPFKININNQSLCISCSGQLGLHPKESKSFSIVGDSLSIKSLPVGCLSTSLPFATFNSILCSAGLSVDVAKRLFLKVREVNIKARCDILARVQGLGLGAQAELSKALSYEIELIKSAFC